jgi:PAS domain S-box-containing protein
VKEPTSPLMQVSWLSALVAHGTDLITLHDHRGRIIYATPSVSRILGYDPGELCSRNLDDLLFDDDRNAVETHFQFLRDHPGVPRVTAYRIRHSGGSWRWMEATGTNLLADPTVAAIVMNQHDITERRDAEEAVKQSEQRFRALVENSEDGIELSTKRGTVLYVSPSVERILGRPASELVGRNVFELLDNDDRDRLVGQWQRTLDNARAPVRAEFRLNHPSGQAKFIELVRVNRLDDPGLRAVVTIFRDVSVQRDLEEQVRQSQKMEAVGRLAGGIAHDFNNILSAVHGFAQIVDGDLKEGDPLHADMEEIFKAVERGTGLTKKLLAFGRRQVLQPRAIHVGNFLRDVERMLLRLIGEDIVLQIKPQDDTQPAKADPSQLEQVLLNLVVNARDAMPRGGRLSIENEDAYLTEEDSARAPDIQPGRYVCLTVSDTGTGMTREVQDRIFEPFFTTKQTGKGTGLGLSTVFGIVKQSGGHIQVASEIGRGSTFRVYFPVTDEKPTYPSPAPPRNVVLGGHETILLVEDEVSVRHFVARTLRREGYQVLDASNGGEALLIAEQHAGPIHLLLTDVVMPRLSGQQLAERLAPLRNDMRVIYMSGYAEDAVMKQGVLDRGVDFIEKPLTTEALGRKVRDVLDRPLSGRKT